ncbi:MAG: hypothetical protein ACLQJR_16685 [Stellaceae bacterium]
MVENFTAVIALQKNCNYPLQSNAASIRAVDGGKVDTISLHEEAERCRRLAKSIYNPTVTEELEAYAAQLEERAAELSNADPPMEPAT